MNVLIRARADADLEDFRIRVIVAAYHAQTILNSFSKRRIDLVKKLLDQRDTKKPAKVTKQPDDWNPEKEWDDISEQAEEWLERGRADSRAALSTGRG